MEQENKQKDIGSDPWLSLDEVAKHLKISKPTIFRWLEKGKIPAHKVGKQWRFKASEIDNWVLKGDAATNNDNEQL